MPPRQTNMIPKRVKLAPTRSEKYTKTARDDLDAAHGGPTQGLKTQKAILLQQNTKAGQHKTHPIRMKTSQNDPQTAQVSPDAVQKTGRQPEMTPTRFTVAPPKDSRPKMRYCCIAIQKQVPPTQGSRPQKRYGCSRVQKQDSTKSTEYD